MARGGPNSQPAAGNVEIGLVDGSDLDEVGVVADQLDQIVVHRCVCLHIDRQKHSPRAEALGLKDGHGAMDAEDACLV